MKKRWGLEGVVGLIHDKCNNNEGSPKKKASSSFLYFDLMHLLILSLPHSRRQPDHCFQIPEENSALSPCARTKIVLASDAALRYPHMGKCASSNRENED